MILVKSCRPTLIQAHTSQHDNDTHNTNFTTAKVKKRREETEEALYENIFLLACVKGPDKYLFLFLTN